MHRATVRWSSGTMIPRLSRFASIFLAALAVACAFPSGASAQSSDEIFDRIERHWQASDGDSIARHFDAQVLVGIGQPAQLSGRAIAAGMLRNFLSNVDVRGARSLESNGLNCVYELRYFDGSRDRVSQIFVSLVQTTEGLRINRLRVQ